MPRKLYQEAERFVRDQFWGNTHDPSATLKLADMVEAKLVADNAAKDPDYYGHRMGVVHVSSLYGCVRSLIHQAIGSPKTAVIEPRKLGIFKAGNLFEDFVVDALDGLVLNRQTEYLYRHNGLVLTGRDDGLLLYDGKYSILEAKSVHSNSFWNRQREGTLVQWHNQIQLTTYLWLRRNLPFLYMVDGEPLYTNLSIEEVRQYKPAAKDIVQVEKPDHSELTGIFSYISKDDCQVMSAPIRFNQNIIDEIVLPVIELVAEGYTKVLPLIPARDEAKAKSTYSNLLDDPEFEKIQNQINDVIASVAPAPAFAVWEDSKKQWQINWLCKYNDWADLCYGRGWVLVAQDEVKRLNIEAKSGNVGAMNSAVDSVRNGQ
jgi:hypothetical protein